MRKLIFLALLVFAFYKGWTYFHVTQHIGDTWDAIPFVTIFKWIIYIVIGIGVIALIGNGSSSSSGTYNTSSGKSPKTCIKCGATKNSYGSVTTNGRSCTNNGGFHLFF